MRVDWSIFWPRILDATGDTLLMVIVTLIFATILGIPLGLLLYVTRKGNFLENKWVFSILNIIINTIRPIPFIIFLVALSPLTRSVIGTTIGTAAAIFPMTLVASIGIARMVETNLVSVPKGVIEAAQAMGASPIRIVFEILVPEALAPLILGVTFMTVGLIEFSAVAGLVGGGGLGDLAMTYGYQRFDTSVMFVTVVLLIILVQLAQNLGNYFAKVFFTQIIKGRGGKENEEDFSICIISNCRNFGVKWLLGCRNKRENSSHWCNWNGWKRLGNCKGKS